MKYSLYYADRCPYCDKVIAAAYNVPLRIELRNINSSRAHLQALQSRGGRLMVPCLRIEDSEVEQWMYESDDIIEYLSKSS